MHEPRHHQWIPSFPFNVQWISLLRFSWIFGQVMIQSSALDQKDCWSRPSEITLPIQFYSSNLQRRIINRNSLCPVWVVPTFKDPPVESREPFGMMIYSFLMLIGGEKVCNLKNSNQELLPLFCLQNHCLMWQYNDSGTMWEFRD